MWNVLYFWVSSRNYLEKGELFRLRVFARFCCPSYAIRFVLTFFISLIASLQMISPNWPKVGVFGDPKKAREDEKPTKWGQKEHAHGMEKNFCGVSFVLPLTGFTVFSHPQLLDILVSITERERDLCLTQKSQVNFTEDHQHCSTDLGNSNWKWLPCEIE